MKTARFCGPPCPTSPQAMADARRDLEGDGRPEPAAAGARRAAERLPRSRRPTLWNQSLHAPSAPRRRSATGASPRQDWAANPASAYIAADVPAERAHADADGRRACEGDEKTRQRVRFAVQQWIDAASPSNYLALNPEAQRKAIETQGREHRARPARSCWNDVQQGHVSQTDESVFEVGRNVATSEGSVVFENELFQLIEYKPLTAKVYERPMLFVPPCINKFYILDLQPENSLIRYTVDAGPPRVRRQLAQRRRRASRSCTWDDYIEDAAIRAIGAGAGDQRQRADQHAGLLRRRHDPRDRAGGARRARRAAGGEHDAADDLPRLQRAPACSTSSSTRPWCRCAR